MACNRMRLRKESKSIFCTILCNLFFILVLPSGLLLVSSCNDTERVALLNFKSMLVDPSNRLSSWRGQDCCNWQGIKCSESGHVIVVNLRNPQPQVWIRNSDSELISVSNTTSTALKGTLSSSLFTLKHIRYLDLSYNNLMSSKLPAEISSCTELEYLNLSNAMLKDFVTTQLANLTSLRSLDLSCSEKILDASAVQFNLTSLRVKSGPRSSFIYNGYLSSPNLFWVQGLRNLRVLRLNGVDISEASHSTKWAEPISLLYNLRSLHLSNCKISGNVPIKQFLNLTNLQKLILDSNAFNSPVPDHLANITHLSTLDFSNNSLHGYIPHFPQLKELHVGENPNIMVDLKAFSAVPWSNLEILDIDSTQVIGEMANSIANMTSLVSLSAAGCSIQGSLPASITNLSRLEVLWLDDNYITGNLSSSISNLKNLRLLSLAQNKIGGYIPERICEITHLRHLNLNSNLFVGSLPECIVQHPNLISLEVADNMLAGTIPLYMFQKSNMFAIMLGLNAFSVKVDQQQFQPNFQPQILELTSCNIGGQIPDFISNLTNLEYLSLSNNSLSGTIPSWLFNLPKLSVLDLSLNKLEGVIPTTIQLYSSSLFPTILNLAGNKLQGTLPSRLKNVKVINLSVNNFTGHVPIELGEVLGTKYISFSDNILSGEIPQSFCRAGSALMVLDLSRNSLTGTIPPSLGNCTSLLQLKLQHNVLGGIISDELAGAKSLAYLDLNGNYFRGPFPRIIQNFQQMESLDLSDNKFEGRIPQFIGDLHNLRIINLAFNFFNESIPQELMKLEHLQYVSFSTNRLCGTIPSRMGGLKMLTGDGKEEGTLLAYLVSLMFSPFQLEIVTKGLSLQLEAVHTYTTGIDLSSNSLTGKIPDEICLLKGLSMINFSHNALGGEIPQMIGEMRSLESLDLSFNHLNSEIPTSVTLIDNLQWLNLSHNNLSGKVPTSPHFDTLSVDGSAYTENRYLCDVPGGLNCTSKASKVHSSTATDDAEDEMPLQVLVGIVMLGFLTGALVHFAILFLVKVSWREKYWKAVDIIVLKILNYK